MEFDLVNHPHPHPLILYQEGKPYGDNVCCAKCHQPWRPPVFGCLVCNFLIHLSCIHLPPVIHTPFHPHHSLRLGVFDYSFCNCCGQEAYDHIYFCQECHFRIDIQCAIADTKASGVQRTTAAGGEFRHFSHPHPLTLLLPRLQKEQQIRENRKDHCFICKTYIEPASSTYFCSTCDSHSHRDCAEQPREILKPDLHKHSLFLFSSGRSRITCQICTNYCSNFFYRCPRCKYSDALHLPCIPLAKHQHEFYDFRKVLLKFYCLVCDKMGFMKIPWICKICHVFVHKECAEVPSILYMSKHVHPLTLTLSLDGNDNNTHNQCGICLGWVTSRAYVCSQCKYIAHLDCAKYLQTEHKDDQQESIMQPRAFDPCRNNNANNNFNLIQGTEIIRHFSHKHNLRVCQGEDRSCAGCMGGISTRSQSYGCSQCDFYLHEECATLLPRRYKNSFFHSHELSIVYLSDFVFSCAFCLQYCHGFAYYCKECHYTIDIRCVASFPFIHPSHEHALCHCNGEERHKCEACGEGLQGKEAFGCNNRQCNFYLDKKCALLPHKVRNRYDEHPLQLTPMYSPRQYNKFFNNWSSLSEKYCDICEEEREENDLFYSCNQCDFATHINCVLGDYPFLKSAQFEGHQHPLGLVKEGKKGHSACGECGDSCEGNLTFECGDLSCKFSVHAFGPCYHRQLTQGRLTFTMPSLRYRSIPLSPNIDHEEKNNLILFDVSETEYYDDINATQDVIMGVSLRQHGGGRGKLWDDRVFSSVKRVVITHGQYIHSIQTQYYDHNGSLTWSDRHGGNGGHTSEVELDNPDEYLISICGCMGDFEDNYMIRSLVLATNKKIYGPFGTEQGTTFSFPLTRPIMIVGFHGRSSYCLDSIGIKVVPHPQETHK